MALLPSDVPTRLVTATMYFVNEDSVDPDTKPEYTVVTGSVVFTASPKTIRMPSKPAIFVPLTFEGVFNSEGQLIPKDGTGVGMELIVTDSPLLNPTDWTWTCTFNLKVAGTQNTVNIDSFSFQLPAGAEPADLVSLMPVSTSGGVLTIQGPKGDIGAAGLNGSNVLPTDTGIAQAMQTPGTQTNAALNVAIGQAQRVYADMPYNSASDIFPAKTDTTLFSGWGSSTISEMTPELTVLAAEYGATYFNGGKGGEVVAQIEARLGSSEPVLVFPSNTIPASGAVNVTSPQLVPSSLMKEFTGTIAGVAGKLTNTLAGGLVFTRSTPGTATSVPAGATFSPTEGIKNRAGVWFLNMGKNNLNASSESGTTVIEGTARAFNYHAALNRRVLVLGHFADTGTVADSLERVQIQRVNAAYKERYGALYLDISELLTSSSAWVKTGITPTPEDLSEQALGNKPLSLSRDTQHMNGPGKSIVVQAIREKLWALGWFSAPLIGALIAHDDFNRIDGALGNATSGQTWNPPSGIVIKGSMARVADSGSTKAVIDTGTTDGVIELTAGGENTGILFRATKIDVSNYGGFIFCYSASSGRYRLTRRSDVNASYTQLGAAPTSAHKVGDVLRVRFVGGHINCFVNGELLITAIDGTYRTSTLHGVWGFGPHSVTPMDDFKFSAP